MTLCFPNADTFRLVLTSTLLPADVTTAPAEVVFAADGKLFVETPHKLTKKAAGELTKLGVSAVKALPGEPEKVSCWPQIVPTAKDRTPPQLSTQAPVLFELPSADDLPGMVGEMVRLGNDRQGFRWLASAEDPADKRVLLRVIGPPYYTLLRALDQLVVGAKGPVRAYTEAAPRVWVEVGRTHPFAAQVKLPEDAAVLISGDRTWSFLAEQPFRDVYEVLHFTLPGAAVEWRAVEENARLTVPLKLVAGTAADAAELWVLRGDGADQLDAFVKEADDRLLDKLKFAVATSTSGEQVVVLRLSSTRGTPPAVTLPGATGYKPHSSLPNLFVPAGWRLHPQLRRDAVRGLLADDLDSVVWLHPTGQGGFVPESVPDAAFHPLSDWVEYVIETAHAPLKEWIESARFDFAQYTCTDDKQPPKPKDPGKKEKGKGDKDADPLTPDKAGTKRGGKKADDPTPTAEYATPTEQKKPNEWKVKRDELQKQFLAVDGGLDHPDRVALWPGLAVANTGAGDPAEAALCWANALWEAEEPDAAAVRAWATGEFGGKAITRDEFERRLKQADPHQGEVRQFAAAVLALAQEEPPPAWLVAELPKAQKFVEAHEPKLPVRVAWLAATRLARLSGADVLGLARIRDRLLQRLLEHGLNPELDLPFFLRTAGLNDSDRVRHVRDAAGDLHKLVRGWAEEGSKTGNVFTPLEGNPTAAYVDLLFAYGLTRLGEANQAAKLQASGKATLEKFPADNPRGLGIAGRFLYTAFEHRIQQAAAGRSVVDPLPDRFRTDLERFAGLSSGRHDTAHGYAHNAVKRMFRESKLLDPMEQHDPYKQYMAGAMTELKHIMDRLAGQPDPKRLVSTIRELYRGDGPRGGGALSQAERQFLVLQESLPLAARCGGEFAAELIRLVPTALRQSYTGMADANAKQAGLLARGLFLAGHFDRRDLVGELVDTFVESLGPKPEEQRFELVNIVTGSCIQSLRKFGLRDEIDRLLGRLAKLVTGGSTVGQMKARLAAHPEQWQKALQSLLCIAGGWFHFGPSEQANEIVAVAKEYILAPAPLSQLAKLTFSRMLVEYVHTLGRLPSERGMQEVGELFRKIPADKVQNGYTTAEFFSQWHFKVAEEVVLAVVSDDFALGTAGRRWLEDDEYLVRRRIHADMKAVLAGSGL